MSAPSLPQPAPLLTLHRAQAGEGPFAAIGPASQRAFGLDSLAGLRRGGPWREVTKLAWPAVAHMLLVTLMFMADRALVGRYSSEALASLQISTTLSWSLCSLFGALAIATTALASRALGAQQPLKAAAITRLVLGLGAAAGILVGLACWGLADSLIALFPTTPTATQGALNSQAVSYLRWLAPAFPLAFVEAIAVAALHSAGDTRTPLRAAVLANGVNLLVSAALVFGWGGLPELGAAGAAIGSGLAFAIQAAWVLAVLLRRGSPLPLRRWLPLGTDAAQLSRKAWRRAQWRAHQQLWPEVRRIALPAAGEKLVFHAGYLGYVGMVALLGTTAMASNQALVSIEALGFTLAEGCGVAAAILVGRQLGARRKREALRSCLAAACLATAALALAGLLFLVAPATLMGIFSDDAAVVALGAGTLWIAALAQPFMAFATVISMGLRAAGATRTVLWTTLCCSVIVRLLASWWLAIDCQLGLVGIWLGSGIDWLLHSVVLCVVLWRGRWSEPRAHQESRVPGTPTIVEGTP